MPNFPTKEADILQLSRIMYDGSHNYPADFPRIDKMKLVIARKNYELAKKTQRQAMAALKIAMKVKSGSLESLKHIMKNCLKISEVDCAACPKKLTEIGWSAKQKPQPVDKPSQPTGLCFTAINFDTIFLKWNVSKGPIRNYIIERRQQTKDGGFSSWQMAGFSFAAGIKLTCQPRGLQLEYRIKAVNSSGQSSPSNTAAVIL